MQHVSVVTGLLAQKMEPNRLRPLLLIMNQTIFYDGTFPLFCQLYCGCLCAKRILEDPYKIVGALLRNKPTSMEGFSDPTQR